MARRSIDSRMDRILDALLPAGSIERREYELSPEMRRALQIHRTRTTAIIRREENAKPGKAYEAMLEGTLQLPEMDQALRDALQLSDLPVITADHSADQAATAWCEFAFGDDR